VTTQLRLRVTPIDARIRGGAKEGLNARTEPGRTGKTMQDAPGFPPDTDDTSSEADSEDMENAKGHIGDDAGIHAMDPDGSTPVDLGHQKEPNQSG